MVLFSIFITFYTQNVYKTCINLLQSTIWNSIVTFLYMHFNRLISIQLRKCRKNILNIFSSNFDYHHHHHLIPFVSSENTNLPFLLQLWWVFQVKLTVLLPPGLSTFSTNKLSVFILLSLTYKTCCIVFVEWLLISLSLIELLHRWRTVNNRKSIISFHFMLC